MKAFVMPDVRLDKVNVVEIDEKFMNRCVLIAVTPPFLFHFLTKFLDKSHLNSLVQFISQTLLNTFRHTIQHGHYLLII
jgi:hypothetical protein